MTDTNNNAFEAKVEVDISDAKKSVSKLGDSISNIFKKLDTPYKAKRFDSVINTFGDLNKLIKLTSKEINSLENKKLKAILDSKRTGAISNKLRSRSNLLASLEAVRREEFANIKTNTKFNRGTALSGAFNISTEPLKTIGGSEAKLNRTESAARRLGRTILSLGNSSEKTATSWSKLMGRIKNISIYRTIRSAMRWLTQGVSEGLQGLAQYSDEVNESMSNINNSLNQVRNTLAISFASVLKSLEPVIISVTDSVVNVLNAFNRALAKAQGEKFWYEAKKASDIYAESAKKAQKFTFDAFQALSGDNKTDTSKLFNKVYFSEEAKQAAGDTDAIAESADRANSSLDGLMDTLVGIGVAVSNITEALGGLKTVLIVIAGIGIYKGITSIIGGINTLIPKIQNYNLQCSLAKTKTQILQQTWKSLAAAGAAIGVSVATIVSRWGEMSSGAKTAVIVIASLTAAFAALAFAVYAAQQRWAKAISVAAGVITTGATVATAVAGFADGGFTTANFIATNENGKREWVGRNAGATAVVNDTQMSDIMYQAVKDGCYQGILQAMYESPSGSSDGGEFVLKVDANVLGRVVAESSGFRNEVNRRNANLNLR